MAALTPERERYANVPLALRMLNQWVAWKRERRDGKWTKVPIRPSDGRTRASVDDPRTWGSFEQACNAPRDRVQGIGFVFTEDDPYCGLDFDGCISDDGELHPAAAEILAELNAYQERSPSQRGMHAIVEAILGSGRKTSKTPWGGDFEVYDRGRFFTVTGQGQGRPSSVQSVLDATILRIFGKQKPIDLGDSDRAVEDLFAQYPKLKIIAAHGGNPPKDESDSGWDHYLACEAVRCELARDEYASILRSSRKDRKAVRADYIKRTWDKARKTVGDTEKDPARRLNLRYNLRGEDAIVRGDPIDDIAGGSGKVYLYTRTGRCYRVSRLGDLFDGPKHTKIMSQVTRSRFAALGPKEAVDQAQTIIELCGGNDANPLEEARDAALAFIAHAGAIVEWTEVNGARRDDWTVFSEYMTVERTLVGPDVAARSAILYDETKEEFWLPAERLQDYSSSRRTRDDFKSDMAEIGWRLEHPDKRGPGGRIARANGQVPRFHRRFYVGCDTPYPEGEEA